MMRDTKQLADSAIVDFYTALGLLGGHDIADEFPHSDSKVLLPVGAIRAIIRDRNALEKVIMEWQPIATAPKDGSP